MVQVFRAAFQDRSYFAGEKYFWSVFRCHVRFTPVPDCLKPTRPFVYLTTFCPGAFWDANLSISPNSSTGTIFDFEPTQSSSGICANQQRMDAIFCCGIYLTYSVAVIHHRLFLTQMKQLHFFTVDFNVYTTWWASSWNIQFTIHIVAVVLGRGQCDFYSNFNYKVRGWWPEPTLMDIISGNLAKDHLK